MIRPVRKRHAVLLAAMATAGENTRSLSLKAGVCEATISEVLNLRVNPTTETRRKLSAALGMSQRDLFSVEDSRNA